VLYGAAEFSRDVDFAILADDSNLHSLQAVLDDLQASPIAVPPFSKEYLQRGHAIHFRCRHPEAARLRVDVMSNMRGVDGFAALWERRTTLSLPEGIQCELLSLPDLTRAKKTQPEKDWPMIRRLVEANYFRNKSESTPEQLAFWFRELRTPELLIDLAGKHSEECQRISLERPLLHAALDGNIHGVEQALLQEEAEEKRKDRDYWTPLKKELEQMRRNLL
jgi:hypothetical protein